MDGDRIRTIYCGLDHERFTLADPPPRSETPLVVSWSRLRRYKSLDVAIRAFDLIQTEMPDARMLIMGRGPDEDRLRKLTAKLGLDDVVEFRGFMPWDELVAHPAPLPRLPEPQPQGGLGADRGRGQPVRPAGGGQRPARAEGLGARRETGSLVPYGDDAAFAAEALTICCGIPTCGGSAARRPAPGPAPSAGRAASTNPWPCSTKWPRRPEAAR